MFPIWRHSNLRTWSSILQTSLIFISSLFLVLYFKTQTYSLSDFNFRFLVLISFLWSKNVWLYSLFGSINKKSFSLNLRVCVSLSLLVLTKGTPLNFKIFSVQYSHIILHVPFWPLTHFLHSSNTYFLSLLFLFSLPCSLQEATWVSALLNLAPSTGTSP